MEQKHMVINETHSRLAERGRPSLRAWRASMEILLLCSAARVSPAKKERISQILAESVDWDHLLKLAEFHGVAPSLAHNIISNGLARQVPPACLERLNHMYHNNLYKNVVLSGELDRVLSLFNKNGIAAIALKGTVLSEQLYGNPGLRTVSDIDILLRQEDLCLAGSLLLEMGYNRVASQKVWDHTFHEVPYFIQLRFPVIIELHWNLEDQRLMAVPQEEVQQRTQRLQTQGNSVTVLSPEDTLLYLSNNLFKASTQWLRSLCDFAELIKKYDTILDWDYVIKSARSWGIEASVYYSLKRTTEAFDMPVPETALTLLKPKVWRRWLLNFLLNQDFMFHATGPSKISDETHTVVRALMMKRFHQAMIVLERRRGEFKRGARLRIAMWITIVLSAALVRKISERVFVSRKGYLTYHAGTLF